MTDLLTDLARQKADASHELDLEIYKLRKKMNKFLTAKKVTPGGVTRFRKFEKTLSAISDFFNVEVDRIYSPTRGELIDLISSVIDTIESDLRDRIHKRAHQREGLVNALIEDNKAEAAKIYNAYIKLFDLKETLTFLAYNDMRNNLIGFDLSIDRMFSSIRRNKLKLQDCSYTINALYWLDQNGARECIVTLDNFQETLNVCSAKELSEGERYLLEIENIFSMPEHAFGKMYDAMEKFFTDFLKMITEVSPESNVERCQNRVKDLSIKKEELNKEMQELDSHIEIAQQQLRDAEEELRRETQNQNS